MQIGKRHLALAAWFYAGAAVVLAIAYLATGELAQGLIYAMATLLLLPAGLIAARVHRLPRRFMTGVIATGLVYLAWLAASFWEGPGAHVLTDVLDLLANAILIGTFAWLSEPS